MADPPALIERGVTLREIEVLRALQEYLSNAEIAARLFVSERTVESHVSSLLRKLQVGNRRELARLGQSLLSESDNDPPTNLPSRPTTFIGRAEELDALDEAIRRHPLVTLVGPGGVGKTRLALETASAIRRRYPGGTWLVDLAPVLPERVPRAVADALALSEQPGENVVDSIASALVHRPATLVILNNCDHVVRVAGELAASIVGSGGPARIVATSRQVFGTDEERVFPVSPLPEAECIKLFVDRARRTAPNVVLMDSDMETVARICRQLDHLPLAIELAAAQIRLLDPEELAKRLDDRFRLLSRPSHPEFRHRSIAATVGWSYDQLPESAKRAFERLSIFAGSCTIDAAESVCAGDGIRTEEVLGLLGQLVDRSMLTRERGEGGVARYRMLETLRLYGRQRLEATGDLQRLHQAHATYYLTLAQAAEPHIFGGDESLWTARLRAEDPNLTVALDWAREHDTVLALRLGVALWQYWSYSWRNQEAAAYLRSVVRVDRDRGERDGANRSLLHAWALTAAASLSSNNREADITRAWAEEAIETFSSTGEEQGRAYARLALAWALAGSGSVERAERILADVLVCAERFGDRVLAGLAQECRGQAASWRGDYEAARRWHQLELATWTEVGSRRREAWAYVHLAYTARSDGDLDGALKFAARALDRLADDSAAAHLRATVADVARLQGRAEEAARIYEEALASFAAAGDRRCLASTHKNLGQLAAGRGAHDEASSLFVKSMKLRHQLGDGLGVAECLHGLAGVAVATERAADGVTLLAAATGLRAGAGADALPEDRLATDSLVATARGLLTAEQFDRAWEAGTVLDADAAVERAHALWPVPSPT